MVLSYVVCYVSIFFFFKQKTAYEMRISDWSSDVCSSDLSDPAFRRIDQFYEEWACAPIRMMENSFDNAHFSFVHKATFGQIDQPKPEKYEMKETDYGFRSEEHTSELQSLMRISYAVFCLKKKKNTKHEQ